MNRTQLVDAITDMTSLTATQAAGALDATLETISRAIAAGEKVTLPGFGTFESRERAARNGRNPQTGEPMKIAASQSPAFKAAAQLKARLRG